MGTSTKWLPGRGVFTEVTTSQMGAIQTNVMYVLLVAAFPAIPRSQ
jgi:hypothetical protein